MLFVIYIVALCYILLSGDSLINTTCRCEYTPHMSSSAENANILSAMLCISIIVYLSYYIMKIKCSLISKFGYLLTVSFPTVFIWLCLNSYSTRYYNADPYMSNSVAETIRFGFLLSIGALVVLYIKLLMVYRITEQDSYVLPYYIDRKEK